MITINAILADAMSKGEGKTVIRAVFKNYQIATFTLLSTTTIEPVVSYYFDAETLQVTLRTQDSEPYPTPSAYLAVNIQRGLIIAGTEYTVDSPTYYFRKRLYDDQTGHVTFTCSNLPPTTGSIAITAATDDAQDIIAAMLDTVDLTPSYHAASEAWKSYLLMPQDTTLSWLDAISIPSNFRQFNSVFLPRRDRAIHIVSSNTIYNSSTYDPDTGVDHHSFDTGRDGPLDDGQEVTRSPNITWLDDLGTQRYYINSTPPLLDLGYIPEQTSNNGAKLNRQTFQSWKLTTRPILSIEHGDYFYNTYETYDLISEEPDVYDWVEHSQYMGIIEVVEIFKSREPVWQQTLRPLRMKLTGKGGTQHTNIADIEQNQPINTTFFDGILAAKDSTLQAALDTIDDHAHAAAYQPLDADLTSIAGLSPSNDDVIQRKSGSWINRTITQLWTDIIALFPVAAGTWTPNLTNTTNIDASVAYACPYIRILNVVLCAGLVEIDATATGAVVLKMSLPVSSNFTVTNDANGNVGSPGANSVIGSIIPDTTNDVLDFRLDAKVTTNVFYRFVAVYVIK